MSGLLERIARRRRASASRRVGPPSQNGSGHSNGTTYADASPATAAVNGSAPLARQTAPPAPAPEHETAPPPPAPEQETPEPSEAPAPAQLAFAARPGFLERGRMRRRARYLRKLREVQMRDIGGFLLELHRFGRQRPDLVQAKIAGAVHTDRELRALERALGEQQLLREVREPGLGGACENCGAVHGSLDRFCASCGEPLGGRTRTHDA